ncbi:ABC transporter ATP-binding protein [bacterium]|nr:ABC transporter ATP-binding protein [bacterium]
MTQPNPTHPTPRASTLVTLCRLLGYLRPYKWRFALVIGCLLLANLDSIVNSLYLQILIDKYITPLLGSTTPDYSALLTSVVTMAIIYAVGVLVSFLSELWLIPITMGIMRDIREHMFAHMQSLPLEYFDNNPFGDVMSRYTNDTDNLEMLIGRAFPNIISSLTMIAMALITMFRASWLLSLVSLSVIALMFVATRIILSRSGQYFRSHQQILGDVNAYIEEMISGQKVIKVFAHEAAAKREFAAKNAQLATANRQANTYTNILMPVMFGFSTLQTVVVALVGVLLALHSWGGVTLGLIAAFLQLNRNLSRPINNISQQFNSLIMGLASCSRIFALLDETSEPDEGTVTLVNVRTRDGHLIESSAPTHHWAWKKTDDQGQTDLIPLQGDVRFHHVNFSYEPGKQVLFDVTFFAEPGQKIAFVGHTGAGKTTITNLLNRFYDIDSGEILLDGLNIQDIKKADLRRSLGIVLQETNLFTGSVRDNIVFGAPEASAAQVDQAVTTAHAQDFIAHLPDGLRTPLAGNGQDLSAGQRQLLTIARAAVCDPPVMILDEATSSVDTRSEKYIQAGMDELMRGRTTLIIAHRLSTVRSARAIMVIDGGRIIESGSHDKLLAQKGLYYQLYSGSVELA